MFEHDFRERVELETIFTGKEKFYILPTGERLPSVTTVLSKFHNQNLAGWRKSVGEEYANKVSTRAKNRGTAVHDLCERYVLNDPDYMKGSCAVHVSTFMDIKSILDTHITKIYGIEFPLYSIGLNTAGTADLLCDWNGMPAIVDFKTSAKIKKEEWIQSYFEQATVYSIMATHQLKIPFHKFVVVMMMDNLTDSFSANPKLSSAIYEKSPFDYVVRVKEIFCGGKK